MRFLHEIVSVLMMMALGALFIVVAMYLWGSMRGVIR